MFEFLAGYVTENFSQSIAWLCVLGRKIIVWFSDFKSETKRQATKPRGYNAGGLLFIASTKLTDIIMKFVQFSFSSFDVSHLFITKNRLDPLSSVFFPMYCQNFARF